MISLTLEQQDALIEIGNVGMSKAAKQLSILLNSPIKITIPKISTMSLEEIKADENFHKEQIYSLVSQMLTADLNGSAALLLRREYANLLTMSVIEKMPEFTQKESLAYEQEALLEIGNIIITACISVIADMLFKTVHLNFPVYNENKFLPLLADLCMPLRELNKNYIAITTRLDTSNNSLSGHLLLILTEDSIEVLLNSIKTLIGK